MPTPYVSPTSNDVIAVTSVNSAALGLDSDPTGFSSLMATLISRAEAEVGRRLGVTLAGTLFESGDVMSLAQEAVCYRVGARYLRRCAAEKGEGTFQPLLVETSKSIDEIVDDFKADARDLESLIGKGGGVATSQVGDDFDTPSVSPCIGSHTDGCVPPLDGDERYFVRGRAEW